MDKLTLGSLAIILGGLILSVELYALKLIQTFDASNYMVGHIQSGLQYALEPHIAISLCITIAVVLYGVYLVEGHFKDRKSRI